MKNKQNIIYKFESFDNKTAISNDISTIIDYKDTPDLYNTVYNYIQFMVKVGFTADDLVATMGLIIDDILGISEDDYNDLKSDNKVDNIVLDKNKNDKKYNTNSDNLKYYHNEAVTMSDKPENIESFLRKLNENKEFLKEVYKIFVSHLLGETKIRKNN